MRVKICGLTQVNQAQEIVTQGANSLGFICVERSPRYIPPEKIKAIAISLPSKIDKVGVFADHSLAEITKTVAIARLTSVQLHGAESPDFCDRLRQALPPNIELIKAFRIKTPTSLEDVEAYLDRVDTLLLDAYHPQMLGGTGHTIDWQDLQQFHSSLPWMLAGGLTPDNINDALSRLKPDGIDLSSGVERAPGDKDLTKVTQLFEKLASVR
ncbi:phosphoribosylanthranilate isomerase [Waterburya agarophytonicola K14]|uniref:N-(5'-phosphoribosyl)anthranilate isomerase n=1 Tax=Waterburya agarophytonicola KI4 TaxID=2874699 RepID=A0A964BU55_9CYAN|nr:phosphoribosylanthranilate isomerase [Waterburya agarophytonicola]MCC0178762.1 phosphoribosylanthranilate isomerase [Waterburya agarophytonicola KI4]